MAITYRTNTNGGGTSGTTNRVISVGAATINANDLLVVMASLSANTNATPTCSDNQGGTYYLVCQALRNSSADNMAVFVRDALVASAVQHDITVASGSNSAGQLAVAMCAGSLRVGSDAIRTIAGVPQVGTQANQAASTTPTPALPAACLTNNMTIWGVANGTVAASVIVPNASWTERTDSAQSSPTTGLEYATRNSGFTGTSVAAGGTSSTAFSSFILELDDTAAPVANSFDPFGMSGFFGLHHREFGRRRSGLYSPRHDQFDLMAA